MASKASLSDSSTCSEAVTTSYQTAFVCQRCFAPLHINQDFNTLPEATTDKLKQPVSPSPEVNPEEVIDIPISTAEADLMGLKVNIVVPPLKNDFLDSVGNEDRVTPLSPQITSDQLRINTLLFNQLSSNNAYVDHPLCTECANTILTGVTQQLKMAEEEHQIYKAFMEKLENEKDDGGAALKALEKELSNLQCEEKQLDEELVSLDAEQQGLEQEIEKQLQLKDQLLQKEEKYWKDFSKLKLASMTAEDDEHSLQCKMRSAQDQLDKLSRVNVLSVAFHIEHDDQIATINGLRLGSLSSNPVEWDEIDAAWGHTALLLSCLAEAIGLNKFQRYKLVPYGNCSYINDLANGKTLPLYGSGSLKSIFETKFDKAMVAFLDCLQQFAAEIEQNEFSLPYEMHEGKIREKSDNREVSKVLYIMYIRHFKNSPK